MLRVVLDTNIVIAGLSAASPVHWVIEALMSEKYALCISHDILLEYEEVLKRKYNQQVAENFLRALQELPNALAVEVFYNWNLVPDPDDNKFADAAIAAGASYLVTEDRDFNLLKNLPFPVVPVIDLQSFRNILFP